MFNLKVSGMTCGHCVTRVTDAVRSVPRVKGVTVDLKAGEVRVDGDASVEAVADAIASAGYRVGRQLELVGVAGRRLRQLRKPAAAAENAAIAPLPDGQSHRSDQFGVGP